MGEQLRHELKARPWLAAAVSLYLVLTAVELVRVVLVARPASGAVGVYEWELAMASPGPPLSRRLRIEDGGDPGAPAAPSDVVAIPVSADRVELTWTDNADDEQGFKLQRATPQGLWESIWIGHDRTSWADDDVRGATHCYRVRSFNAAGQSLYAYPSPPCIEPRPRIPFRWTAGDAALEEPLEGAVVTIPLYAGRPDLPGAGVEVALSVEGRPIERLWLRQPGWHHFSYYLPILLDERLWQAAQRAIPAGVSSVAPAADSAMPRAEGEGFLELTSWHRPAAPPPVRFGIEVRPTFVPAMTSAESDDTRRLGLGLGALQWSALPPEDIGFYGWETFIDGRRFRWTRRQASMRVESAGPIAVFALRADNPDIDARPLEVSVYWNERLVGEIELHGRSWVEAEIELDAPPGSTGVLSVRTARTWIPAQAGVSADERVLGVAMTEIGWR